VSTLDALLRERARQLTDRVAVEAVHHGASPIAESRPRRFLPACERRDFRGAALTYRELDHAASCFAALLREQGCRAGDRVILGFGNTPAFFAALFGCFRAGCIAAPLDEQLALAELQAIVDHAEPAAIVVDERGSAKFQKLQTAARWVAVEDLQRAASAVDSLIEAPTANDPALLLYTSGSTGTPKGVVYTHQAIVTKLDAIVRHFSFDAALVSLCLLPTHFGHGLICNALSAFSAGGKLILAPPFNLDLLSQLWQIVATHAVTYFSSVPTVVRLLSQYARRAQVKVSPSLQLVTCASAPLWVSDIETFERDFGVPLLNCYGLTETSGWSACSPNTASRDRASVGIPLACEIRVVDVSGQVLAPGERGQIQIKGPCLMSGYYRSPELTQQVLREGWFATGDFGEVSAAGAVTLHSRIKDLIIRAGKNIYPAEVDRVLMSHPEVADACTVGLNDSLLGEKVAACVVRDAGSTLSETTLIAYTQQKLAAYKCPQQIAFVERIPKTSRGKVNRSSLRSVFSA
jgi:acyl-CoA synthetase (AMP-forming)/AMP-acid ligase II